MKENDEDPKLGASGGPAAQMASPLMSPKMSAFYDTSTPSFMSSSPRLNFKSAAAAADTSPPTAIPLPKKPKISTTPKLATVASTIPRSDNTENDINLYEDDDVNIGDASSDDDDFLDGFELGNDDESNHDDVSDDENDGDNEDDEDDAKKLKVINRMLRKLTSMNDVSMKKSDDDVSDDDSDCESVLRMPLPSPYRVPIVCDPPPPTPPPSRLGTLDESDTIFSLYGNSNGNNSAKLEFLSPSFLNCDDERAMVDGGGNDGDVEIRSPVVSGNSALSSLGRVPSLYELSHPNNNYNNNIDEDNDINEDDNGDIDSDNEGDVYDDDDEEEDDKEEKDNDKEKNNNSDDLLSYESDDSGDDDDTYTYKFEISETDPYPFIHRLVKSFRPQSIKRNILGAKAPNTPKVTLVLDLDETLVHCTTDRNESADASFSVFWNNQTYYVSAMKRPFLEEFMEEVTSMFEVVIFTASQRIYADKLLNILDPAAKWSKLRLFRDSCAFVEGNYIKDLSVLGRDLSHVVIIDNSPQAFAFHYNNALPISSWFDSDSDTELIKILPLLKKLARTEGDVRPILRERFKLYEKIE